MHVANEQVEAINTRTHVCACDTSHIVPSASQHQPTTRYCLITSSDSFSLGTKTSLAPGTILVANFFTRSLNVAEKSSTWRSGLTRRRSLIIRTESSANPSACVKWDGRQQWACLHARKVQVPTMHGACGAHTGCMQY